jgi:arylsulfatase A-like enzyme
MPQPNILLIFSDQHRYDAVGANGHPLVQTPNLDRLAREGVNFSHAFTPIALCVPARASLLTGLWPIQHRLLFNEGIEAFSPLRPGLSTFTRQLAEQGYYLGCSGKWHAGADDGPHAYGFVDYVAENGYRQWRAEQGLPPVPGRNGFFGETDPTITPEQSRLAWTAGNALDLMRKGRDSGRPFFVMWTPGEPHLPNVVPEPYASLYPPDSVPPWPSFGDPLTGKPYIQRQQRVNWRVEGWSWEQWAPTVGRYLGEISLIDAQIGRMLNALDAWGLAENTLVVYTCDHGDLCGGHGMVDKHYVMYDDIYRVPFIVRWPAATGNRSGSQCNALVTSGLDLACTFCEAAGAAVPEGFAGRSLLPLLAGEQDPHGDREYVFASYHGNQFGLFSQRMARDHRWKYVWNLTAEDELYDTAADPGELRNLAAGHEHAAELARLRHALAAWLQEVKDPVYNMFTRRQLDFGEKA